MAKVMLTTIDNPYDPFTQYEEWYAYDQQLGYHTPGYLARIAITSDEMTIADQELAIEQAIDEIISINPYGVHKKVTEAA